MGPTTRRANLVLTDGDLSDTDKILLELAHEDETDDHASQVSELSSQSELDEDRVLELAEWVYLHVEEVWSAFNLLAEAVARGFEVTPEYKKDRGRVAEWNRRVDVEDKVRLWVKNALVYGHCVMEAGEDFCKVRNPRSITIEQDEDGNIVSVEQDTDAGTTEIPTERVHVFTLHRLHSDDVHGISACRPVLQTVDDQLGVRKINRTIQERYRAPIRIIEMPEDATDADRRSVQKQLEETPPDMDLVLPPGAEVHVLNHGRDSVPVDDLMKQHFADRIFLGLGIPKIALGIPDDSNRATSRVQRKMLLAEKVQPYQRRVRQFSRELYHEVLGVNVEIDFAPVDARDEEKIANVSKTLVEAGIKTAEEVEEQYWDWGGRGSTA